MTAVIGRALTIAGAAVVYAALVYAVMIAMGAPL